MEDLKCFVIIPTMSGTRTKTMTTPSPTPKPVTKPTIGEVTDGLYPWTGGMPNAAFTATTRKIP